MVTTIQLNKEVKKALDRLKTKKQTYEQVILELLKDSERCKKNKKRYGECKI